MFGDPVAIIEAVPLLSDERYWILYAEAELLVLS
jgi:hypothetical protein